LLLWIEKANKKGTYPRGGVGYSSFLRLFASPADFHFWMVFLLCATDGICSANGGTVPTDHWMGGKASARTNAAS
jgi:hypothetical protein